MRDDETFSSAAGLLPYDMRGALAALPRRERDSAEELRLRVGYPPSLLHAGGGTPLCCRPVTPADLDSLLQSATGASAHTALASVTKGYVTVRGGIRLGLCGQAVMKEGELCALRSLSSVCIRIPRECRGCANGVWPRLTENGFRDTLIISPPGGGKTTLLREICRLLSEHGSRVAVADERGEVAGMLEGRSVFDLGPNTDVITGAPKLKAAMLLLRSMNPQVIAMDELSSPEDAEALAAAAGCGVKILATAHAGSAEELLCRPVYRQMLDLKLFRQLIVVSRTGGERAYEVKML